jgi:hypothetical protein
MPGVAAEPNFFAIANGQVAAMRREFAMAPGMARSKPQPLKTSRQKFGLV